MKIQFLDHTSHIPSAQESQRVSGYCNNSANKAFPSSQIVSLDSFAKIPRNTHFRKKQRADDLSREDRVLKRKCIQCQMLRKAEKNKNEGGGIHGFGNKEIIGDY